jgi:alpha-galactosidase
MSKIGFERNGNPAHAGPGGWNDPDMLEVGNGGMNLDEYRTHLSLWALSAAPLVMGHDVRTMSKETRALLENPDLIAIDQDALGIQGRAVRKDSITEVWSKPLVDGSVAVGLFNRDSDAQRIALAVADTGLAGVSHVRDLWTGDDLQALPKNLLVAPHGVALLRVYPDR